MDPAAPPTHIDPADPFPSDVGQPATGAEGGEAIPADPMSSKTGEPVCDYISIKLRILVRLLNLYLTPFQRITTLIDISMVRQTLIYSKKTHVMREIRV